MERILVLADDFTGAAEIVGIGLRYGLAGVVVRGEAQAAPRSFPITVIDTDSRALAPGEAAARVRRALLSRRASDYTLLFKKIDSVLRGPVVAEVDAALGATGRTSAIVVPANPSRGRIIRGGRYFVGGVPLDQTEFAEDPQYPARTSVVIDRVGGGPNVFNAEVTDSVRPGIAMGDVESPDEMRAWAARVTPSCLGVGGADFFAALLERAGHVPGSVRTAPDPGARLVLMVSGTTSAASQSAISRAEAGGVPIRDMPAGVFAGGSTASVDMRAWQEGILGDLHRRGRAVAAVRQRLDRDRAPWVTEGLTEVIAGVLAALSDPCELCVEGGTTASHLALRMGWHEFAGLCELAPGVVRLAIGGQVARWLTIKPGSYPWPKEVWERLA